MLGQYRSLRRELPAAVFKLNPWRLIPFVLLVCSAILGAGAVIYLSLPWYGNLLMALLIGHCWATLSFLAHEILHGSVVKNRVLQDIFGFLGFLPFLISPTFWRFWHNGLHHSYTQRLIQDPDAYPTKRVFLHSKYIQRMYRFTPGSGHLRSYLYFFFWFTFNAQVAQLYFRFRNRIYEGINHHRVNFEILLTYLFAGSYLYWTGPTNWLWLVAVPLAVQNYIAFSYISTNHNLSPLTKENDPLKNSLTVTNLPLLERSHFNFGYHVEHHLFPNVNPVHSKAIHKLLVKKYPDSYQHMPKWKALVALYKTARIYKNNNTLLNPETGETYPTLQPRVAPEPEPETTKKVADSPEIMAENSKPFAFESQSQI